MRGILKDLDSGPSRSRAAPVARHLPTASPGCRVGASADAT